MQTAIHIFKNHKNLASIKFLVVPVLREIMHTANDIHMDPAELIKKYAPGAEICQGLCFDFSMIHDRGQPNLWSINTFTNLEVVREFYQKLGKGKSYGEVKQALYEQVVACLKIRGSLETKADIYERC